MMMIENAYDIGDVLYLKHDKEQQLRMVICIMVYKNGEFMYKLVCGTMYSDHYEYELSVEKNFTIVD